MSWHVCDMDDYRAGPFRTKREAIDWCTSVCLDGRKRPDVRRTERGFYEYGESPLGDGDRRETLYVFREEVGLRYGFGRHLQEADR
jgi:hypothetical protein